MKAVEEASEYLRWVIPVIEYRAERAMEAGNAAMADYLTEISLHCVRAQTELLLAIEAWRGSRQ